MATHRQILTILFLVLCGSSSTIANNARLQKRVRKANRAKGSSSSSSPRSKSAKASDMMSSKVSPKSSKSTGSSKSKAKDKSQRKSEAHYRTPSSSPKSSSPKQRQSASRSEDVSTKAEDAGETDQVPIAPRTDSVPGDLGIRFSKLLFLYMDAPPELDFPLTADDYPMRGVTAQVLRTRTLADAVVLEGDYEMRGVTADEYVAQVGGSPSHPNSDPAAPFWHELEQVVDMQIHRRNNGEPNFTLPMLWDGYDIHDVAAAVHNEYPGYHQANLLKWLWMNQMDIDYDILPFRSNRDIVSLQFRFAHLNTWAVEAVAAIDFCIKWSEGRARPEEVAYLIATGNLTEGVSPRLKEKIDSMNLTDATSFTAYPEGSPLHPAWPAMHSAASAASFWLAVVSDLTDEQYCEALRVDYAVATARTVAGVHYYSDNIAGLNLGQIILSETLAEHLVTNFGSDEAAVLEKIESLRFDWNDFDVEDCSIAGVPIVAL